MVRSAQKKREQSAARPRGSKSSGPVGKRVPRKGRSAPRINPNEGERLQKVLAAAGIASRRECETLILEGRVQVDGQTVTEMGIRVDRLHQDISVDGEPLARPKLVYFAVNKPSDVVCTASDPSGRPRVTDLLPPGVGRVFAVGRLDLASEGLILVTNDGALANQLTHPRHQVEKIYEVQVQGSPDQSVLAQLRHGVHLAEGFAQVVNVRIKSRRKNGTVLEMVLDEGRNREVRRLLAKVGHKVQRLVRIAVGPIRLGEMPRGAVRRLTPDEVRKLRVYVKEAAGRQRGESRDRHGKSRTAAPAGQARKRSAAKGKANRDRTIGVGKGSSAGSRPGRVKRSRRSTKSQGGGR